jgi:hypothetical protein
MIVYATVMPGRPLHKTSDQNPSSTNGLTRPLTAFLRRISELVDVVVRAPVVLSDPDDDPVVCPAVEGRAEVLCTPMTGTTDGKHKT